MKKTVFILSILIIALAACNNGNKKANEDKKLLSEPEQVFMSNLIGFCGQSFKGEQIYSKDGRDSWEDKEMTIHFTQCEEDKVFIPFYVDDDKSRTWKFIAEDGKLRFRHDHRHEDGTPEDRNLYGGYAEGSGTGLFQCFPADNYTNKLLNDDFKRQWNVFFDDDLSKLTYELFLDDELVFAAEFDMTNPI